MLVCHGSITKISRGRWLARLLRLNGCGSRDVGNYNCTKGKAGHPTLAFHCITDFNRRFVTIYCQQLGSRNNKEIVQVDRNVHSIKSEWLKDVCWKNYTAEGRVEEDRGVHLICNNGIQNELQKLYRIF